MSFKNVDLGEWLYQTITSIFFKILKLCFIATKFIIVDITIDVHPCSFLIEIMIFKKWVKEFLKWVKNISKFAITSVNFSK